MSSIDEKLQGVYDEVLRRNPGEAEFHQAVREVLEGTGVAPAAAALRRAMPRGIVLIQGGGNFGTLGVPREVLVAGYTEPGAAGARDS